MKCNISNRRSVVGLKKRQTFSVKNNKKRVCGRGRVGVGVPVGAAAGVDVGVGVCELAACAGAGVGTSVGASRRASGFWRVVSVCGWAGVWGVMF